MMVFSFTHGASLFILRRQKRRNQVWYDVISSFKNFPTDAGWKFWTLNKRFNGLIGEDKSGNYGSEMNYLETILLQEEFWVK